MPDRIDELEKMLRENPDDAFCLYGLAFEHAKDGRLDVAIRLYDRTIAVDPDYCYAYYHKARAQEEAGDLEGAKVTLARGHERAAACGDAQALNEIAAFLDELS